MTEFTFFRVNLFFKPDRFELYSTAKSVLATSVAVTFVVLVGIKVEVSMVTVSSQAAFVFVIRRGLPGSLGLFWARRAHHLHILQGWREACGPPSNPGLLTATPLLAEPPQGLTCT